MRPRASGIVALWLLSTCISPAQDASLKAVLAESVRLRQSSTPFDNNVAVFHQAIRDWVESLLPKSQSTLDADLSLINARIQATLQTSNLGDSENEFDNYKPGRITRIEFSRPQEDPAKLILVVGAEIPCGADEVAYLYDYSDGNMVRLLESRAKKDEGEYIYAAHLSKPNSFGVEMFMTSRSRAQCGSSWNEISYDVFRLSGTSAVALLTGAHEIWFGAEEPYRVVLNPDDLLMEIRARSIDSGVHNRAHILHFKLDREPPIRTDPVALEPRDFVDEWLTRPWSEMESRSAANGKMQKWHDLLAGGFGDFKFIQKCPESRDLWQIGLDMGSIQGKPLPENLTLYFVVQQLEQSRFKMQSISFAPQETCPVIIKE